MTEHRQDGETLPYFQNVVVVTHGSAAKKFPCSPESIFIPIGCYCKRDVCETVDRSLGTANEFQFDFLYVFLINGGFVFVKHSTSRKK